MQVGEIVYLDVCCFKSAFDDAAVERIRREAEAVAAILDAAQAGRFQLVRSPAHDFENERNPREDRAWRRTCGSKRRCFALLRAVRRLSAREIAALGFGPLDALHLAFAEQSAARWFVTTDDRLLNRATSHRDRLRVEVVRPDQFPLESGGDYE